MSAFANTLVRPLARTPVEFDRPCLTEAGFETWLIFHRNVELREFASFEILDNPDYRAHATDYFRELLDLAAKHDRGFVIDTVTWRASPDWGAKLGYSAGQMIDINRRAVDFANDLRDEAPLPESVFVSGTIGPRGDGYQPDALMSADESHDYHALQVEALAGARTDIITALTMTHVGEAAGIVRAAKVNDIPVVVSFTLETDGHLPTGQPLSDAIAEMDSRRETRPDYYMINCAHPDHFSGELAGSGGWRERIKGVRANASRMSHEELDSCEVLDDGDPAELAMLHARLAKALPALRVSGGCCGTDVRHIAAMAEAMP